MLGPGEVPEKVNVIIEIPAGSSVKFEVDKDSGVVFVDRFLHTAMHYPFNYGFVPGTRADDGDPVDVLVLSSSPVFPGCAIKCRPVGVLHMEDEEGEDTKIIAVPLEKVDPEYGRISDISEVPDHLREKIKHFFEHYKDLEKGKWVRVRNWEGAERAREILLNSVRS